MTKIATKKSIKKAAVPFSFSIKNTDITERENFGAFEVIITKKGAMYKNYTGYHLWFTPYTVGPDGKAHETSTYAWLVNLVNMKKATKGHETDFYEGTEMTMQDMLDSSAIMTEAALSHPMTAFIDLDYAAEFANKHMQWLKSMTEKLEEAANTPVAEETAEDIKANLEHDTAAIATEQIANELNNE